MEDISPSSVRVLHFFLYLLRDDRLQLWEIQGVGCLRPVSYTHLAGLNRHALQRAAYFAPMQGKERMAYYMYQISNAGLFFYLFFLNVKVSVSICFFLGVFFYLAGLFICAASVSSTHLDVYKRQI